MINQSALLWKTNYLFLLYSGKKRLRPNKSAKLAIDHGYIGFVQADFDGVATRAVDTRMEATAFGADSIVNFTGGVLDDLHHGGGSVLRTPRDALDTVAIGGSLFPFQLVCRRP